MALLIRDGTAQNQDRLLNTLERLLEIDATDLGSALNQASDMVNQAHRSDKVDVFLYEAGTDSLVALGTSNTPMGRRQQAIGLDRLPLANRGRAVEVFQTGKPRCDGRVELDRHEVRGIPDGLDVRSQMVVPLDVDGDRRGVVQAMSATPDYFADRDLRFLAAVARWIGMLTHRAELVEQIRKDAVEEGRRAAAEELISLLTPRQREIAALITAGLTNEQIAEKLILTKGTVANHVEHILNRLGAARRSQVAALIAEHGLHRIGSQ